MIGRLLVALGAILIIVAVLKFLAVIAIGGAAAGTLLVVGIICVIVGEFVFGGYMGVGRRRV